MKSVMTKKSFFVSISDLMKQLLFVWMIIQMIIQTVQSACMAYFNQSGLTKKDQ